MVLARGDPPDSYTSPNIDDDENHDGDDDDEDDESGKSEDILARKIHIIA